MCVCVCVCVSFLRHERDNVIIFFYSHKFVYM